MKLRFDTPIFDLSRHGIAGLSHLMAKKLAIAVASAAERTDPAEATVADLLEYYPARYEDRSNFIGIDQLQADLDASVELFTRVAGGFRVGRNRGPRQPPLFIFEISASDGQRSMRPVVVYWFVSGKGAENIIQFYSERFRRGTRFVAYGKWEWDSRRNTFALKINNPSELEILPPVDAPLLGEGTNDAGPGPVTHAAGDDDSGDDIERPEFAMVHTARCVPVYRKLGPFQTKRLREIIFATLAELDPASVPDRIPSSVAARQKLIAAAQAFHEIHFPPPAVSVAELDAFRSPAHRRLIFDEFFWLALALNLRRGERRKGSKGAIIEITPNTKARMQELLQFELTGAQKRVLKEIFGDMASGEPMNRLIQGDVGSGKTIVAFLAMFAAMENGYQAALMAPTEILAEQHARNATRVFAKTGYRVALLTGSTRAAERRKLLGYIASQDVHTVIGTHAIIQEGVEFSSLGLAVIDEQHRFGVLQRSTLGEQGYKPDVLVMTATPIPRSLAMTVYGDLDVSVIDEMPPGRTPVKTVVVGEDRRLGVYKGIERELELGRQAYVVYPLIEESEKIDLKAASKMYEELRDKIFPHRSVGLLHGKMKSAEKEAIMRGFVSGELDILVSTTVIEVGVDVPNASLMVIEHAERFGLSQLHQLRGRVGRGAEQSFCVLLTDDKQTATAKERLGIMEETTDGFRIAEKDLEIRGQGEIFGTRQSGIQSFRIADIIRDAELLVAARREADRILDAAGNDPEARRLAALVKADPKFRLGGIG